jgi:exopolyphosphatase/guanosine-5'-triphosphate,3'-diphosphate pyrophosphatase
MPHYGAVDIGTNSVRMQAAEAVPGHPPRILAEDRQVTRIGKGVYQEGRVSDESMDLTCNVLERMARSLEIHGVEKTRAVTTSALRDARNQDEFLERAGKALGVNVEIISGQEEARLIHLGVQSRWPHPADEILIIDIGGGSAEIIQSREGRLAAAFSKPLGAVRLTEVFLKDDPPTPLELRQLDEFIQEKLAPALKKIGGQRPQRTVATAATASAIACAVHEVPRSKRHLVDRLKVSRAELERLYLDLSARDLEQRRKVEGIGPRRAEVIIAGCATLYRILEEFALPSFYYSAAGVRDGIVADLAVSVADAQPSHLDADRRSFVRSMARRYGVSLKHVDKVASLAGKLFKLLASLHVQPAAAGRLLEAAAYLHDIGHFVSDTRHHRHSYYLIANSDLAGFTSRERLVIANLCRYHRKALPAENHENFKALTPEERKTLLALIPLLRLADSLDRSREQRVRDLQVRIRKSKVELHLQSTKNVELEQWAAQQSADVFKQAYDRSLQVVAPMSG